MYPNELKYSKTHEWVRVEGNTARTGITSYAIEHLTDLTYLEIDVEVGDSISKGSTFGIIESVKATSDLYCQTSGEVIAINTDIIEAVEELAQDPYESGWMIEVKLADPSELDDLLSASEYERLLEEQEHQPE